MKLVWCDENTAGFLSYELKSESRGLTHLFEICYPLEPGEILGLSDCWPELMDTLGHISAVARIVPPQSETGI